MTRSLIPWRAGIATTALVLVGTSACAGDTSGPATTTTTTVAAPSISTQPVSLILTRGTGGSMGVTAAGTAPLTYQWYHDSTAISGAITDSLRITASTDADSGSYYVGVTNSAGTASSRTVVVLVRPPVSATAWRQEGGAAVANAREYSSTTADESAVYVFNNGLLTMLTTNATKSGTSSDAAASSTRGQNAAVLSASGSRIYMNGGAISSTDDRSAGVFATGAGSKLTLTGSSVSTAGASSPTVGASNGATVVITGGTLNAAMSHAIGVSAASASDAPVAVTLAGTAAVSAGSGTLLGVTSGASATFTLDSVTVTGNVTVDATSSASVVVQHLTAWTGSVQGAGVTLDATSTWAVNANSAVTVFATPAIAGTSITNVIGNGSTVTYDATLAANAALGGKTFTLAGGGQLKPR